MASDGSLVFDTKVNADGVDGGIYALTKAVEKLSRLIENMSSKMGQSFSETGSEAVKAASDIDDVARSTKAAREELGRLQTEKASTFSGVVTDNRGGNNLPEREGNYDIYGNDVDAIIAKERELEAASRATSATVQTESAKEERSVIGFKDSILIAVEMFKTIPSKIAGIFTAIGGSSAYAANKGKRLVDEIDRLKDHLYSLETKGFYFGDAEYDSAHGALKRAESALVAYKKSLVNTDIAQKKTEKSTRKMSSSLKKTNHVTAPLSKSILKLSNMFKLMLIRMSMRAIIQSVKEGFQNLAQYSDDTNESISELMSANTRLKNSFATMFAPALNAAAPALKNMIDLLSIGATSAARFVAALTGKSTFVKAVDVEEDYAAALKDSNKALKEKEKLTFSFDDLIQSQGKDGYIGPNPDQMFETVEVENDIIDFAETVKGIFSDLFTPMKQSWVENGPGVTAAAKTAFESLKRLAGDVGASFLQVWKDEGYGKAITDDLLITVSDLLLTVANLADRFDEAWKKADNGTNIIRHLGDIVLTISGFFRQASEEMREWSERLDFEPLLKSFDNVLMKMNPVVQKIGGVLLWLLKNALLPLAKWALENGVPAVLDLIAAGFEVLATVLDALQPLATWLWDTFLQPLGKWAGEIFIAAMEKITEWLTKFSDWISEHQELVETMTQIVLGFFAAFAFERFVSGVAGMLSVLPNLIGVLGGLIRKLNPLTLLLGSIISLAVYVASAWEDMTPDEKLATKIIAVAGAVGLLVAALGYVMSNPIMIMGGAAIATIAGISIAGIAYSAKSRVPSSGYSGYSNYYNAIGDVSRYRVPHLATGTVVPPRAGEFAAILGDNNRAAEVVSPLPTMKQAFKEAIEEMGGLGGNQICKADLILDGVKFGQLVYKFNNKERQRVGVRMVSEGGI